MKNKKLLIIIMLILILVLSPVIGTLSRYVYKGIHTLILSANNFYFNSDKLSEEGSTYQVNNWSGLDTFTIQFELNNMKNNILYTTSDITFENKITCDNDITCSLSIESGTIYSSEKQKSITITVTPTRAFEENESVHVHVESKSLSPYVKILKADFTITVGKRGITYEIDDKASSPYLKYIITNAHSGYYVREAFSSYSVGDEISTDTYLSLTDEDKKKCAGATITLTFDPSIIVIDNTSEIIKSSELTYQTIEGIGYINSLKFDIGASNSIGIRFYKKDVSKDYTYPNYTEGDTCIINTNIITDK